MLHLFAKFNVFCALVLGPLINLTARIYVGWLFFRSGLVKIDDFESTVEFFADDWAIPYLAPMPAAVMATAGELILPVMLVLGLATRVSALGLLIMTAVIQFVVMPDHLHYWWMLVLGFLLSEGGSRWSMDNLLFRKANATRPSYAA
jgi:putative oxidoreductase